MAGHSVKEGKLKIDSVTTMYRDVSTVSSMNVSHETNLHISVVCWKQIISVEGLHGRC